MDGRGRIRCSTIIATVGRPSLARAVESVLDQDLPGDASEVIVVNDSGSSLPAAAWQRSSRVHLMDTNRRERSVARNSGAAIARGRYLHFLDDDDWLLPGALQALVELAESSGAGWTYGSSQLVSRQDEPLIQLHHHLNGNCFLDVMAGEWIPLQASVIASDVFFAVGGFNPLLAGPEDIDLLRRVALHYDLVSTSMIVASIVRGDAGSTTDYAQSLRDSRAAREKILDAPRCFSRLRASGTSSDRAGRLVRIYLTSAVWNLQRGRLLSAGSRLSFALAGVAVSGPRALAPSFWRAVGTSYTSRTFLEGFRAARGSSSPSDASRNAPTLAAMRRD